MSDEAKLPEDEAKLPEEEDKLPEDETKLPEDEAKLLEDEAKMRENAAKRLERRRRKMQTSEERLSKITGQPVSASSAGESPQIVSTPPPVHSVPSVHSAPSANGGFPPFGGLIPRGGTRANGGVPPLYDSVPDPLAVDPVPDPPLEDLQRDPFSASADLDGGGLLDANMFNSLMMGNSAGSAGVKPEVKVYTVLWVIVAVCARIILQSPYSHLVGDNMIVPFFLLLTGLVVTRVVDVRNLQSSSLITAALVLCGVKQERVALLTQFLHASRLLVYCFFIYLFSFIVVHLMIETYLESLENKYRVF